MLFLELSKLLSWLYANDLLSLLCQPLDYLITQSMSVFKDQPGLLFRLPLQNSRQRNLFPGGQIEPISHIRFLASRCVRSLFFLGAQARRLNPIALALEGISRQRHAPPLLVPIETAPIRCDTRLPQSA